jgi:hypothetical protein
MFALPNVLIEDIRRGWVVLLLGARASLGAKNEAGQGPPNGRQLRDFLADRFLGGQYRDAELAWVAELAISETNLATVQDWILRARRSVSAIRWAGPPLLISTHSC